jgi:uncharacterized spore protein YtfJ
MVIVPNITILNKIMMNRVLESQYEFKGGNSMYGAGGGYGAGIIAIAVLILIALGVIF